MARDMEKVFAMGKYIVGFFMFCLLLSGVAAGEAAPQVITANGVYIMGENDSPKIAKDAARQEAMRAAVENVHRMRLCRIHPLSAVRFRIK